jgi:hypothetical protein
MKISKSLHLVIPIYDEPANPKDAKVTAYVHSTAISEETFDIYWKPIGIVFSRIYNGGFGVTAGARVADKILREVSQELKIWDTPDGVQAGLIADIHRLTLVSTVGKNGWELLPFQTAMDKGVIDKRDASAIEAALIFFTVASLMHRRSDLAAILELAASLWGLQIESSNSTEFLNSLRTSTKAETSGVTAAA